MRFYSSDEQKSVRVRRPLPVCLPLSVAPTAALPSDARQWIFGPALFGTIVLVQAFTVESEELCNAVWAHLTTDGPMSDERVCEMLLQALDVSARINCRSEDFTVADVAFLGCECRLFQLARIVLSLVPVGPKQLAEREHVRDTLAPAVYALMQVVMHDEPQAREAPELTGEIKSCQSLVTAMLGVLRADLDQLPNPKYSACPHPPVEMCLLSFLVNTGVFFPFLFTSEHSAWLVCQRGSARIAGVITDYFVKFRDESRDLLTFGTLFTQLLLQDGEGHHTSTVWQAVASMDTPMHRIAAIRSDKKLTSGTFNETRHFREILLGHDGRPLDSRPADLQMKMLEILQECTELHGGAQRLHTVLAHALDAALRLEPATAHAGTRSQRCSGGVVSWLWWQISTFTATEDIVEGVLPKLGTASRFVTHFATFKSPAALDAILQWLAEEKLVPTTLREPGSKLAAWDAREDLKSAFVALSRQSRPADFQSLLTFAKRPGWFDDLPLDGYHFSKKIPSTDLLWLWSRAIAGNTWHRVCSVRPRRVMHGRLAALLLAQHAG